MSHSNRGVRDTLRTSQPPSGGEPRVCVQSVRSRHPHLPTFAPHRNRTTPHMRLLPTSALVFRRSSGHSTWPSWMMGHSTWPSWMIVKSVRWVMIREIMFSALYAPVEAAEREPPPLASSSYAGVTRELRMSHECHYLLSLSSELQYGMRYMQCSCVCMMSCYNEYDDVHGKRANGRAVLYFGSTCHQHNSDCHATQHPLEAWVLELCIKR